MDFSISICLITPDGVYVPKRFKFDVLDYQFEHNGKNYSVDVECDGDEDYVYCHIKSLFEESNDFWVVSYDNVSSALKYDVNFYNELEIYLLDRL